MPSPYGQMILHCRSFTWGVSLISPVVSTFQTFRTWCPGSSCQNPCGTVSSLQQEEKTQRRQLHGQDTGWGLLCSWLVTSTMWSRNCFGVWLLKKNHRIIGAGKYLQDPQVQFLTDRSHAHLHHIIKCHVHMVFEWLLVS